MNFQILFLTVATTFALCSCSLEGKTGTASLNSDPSYDPVVIDALDDKNDANASSPLAPEIVIGSSLSSNIRGTRLLLVAGSDQDFKSFSMIKNSALNYNSMVNGTVPFSLSEIDLLSSPTAVSWGPLTKAWSVTGANPIIYGETPNGSITSLVRDAGGEIRQFTAFSVADSAAYEYSCSMFYWDGSSNSFGVDITEVWKYPTYKLVSVTMYWKNWDLGVKYLAVSDTTDEYQRTSMLVGQYDYKTGEDFTFDSYDDIGYIDFSMNAASLTKFSTQHDFLPQTFPQLGKLKEVHMRSIRMTDAKKVTFDHDNLKPFTEFIEK